MSQLRQEIITILVRISRDSAGGVGSGHDFASDLDRKTAMGWPSGGLEQVVFGLLSEAIRREAFLDLIIQMTERPEYQDALRGMGPEERAVEVLRLAGLLCAQVARFTEAVASDAVKEAIGAVLAGPP